MMLCSYFIIVSVLLVQFPTAVQPFRFGVHDMTPLLSRTANAELFFDLSIHPNDLGSSSTLSQCTLCLATNASVCHCFSDPVSDIAPFLPPACVTKGYPYPFRLSLYLTCGGLTTASTPIFVPTQTGGNSPLSTTDSRGKITLVLPVEFGDLQRFTILLKSLTLLTSDAVLELIVIVPNWQRQMFALTASGFSQLLMFQVRIISESDFIPPAKQKAYYPYAIQMTLKLLVSHIVSTDFYLTLDADIILLRNFEYSDFVVENRGIYHHEARFSVHPEWWDKSELFLGIKSTEPLAQGIGATPALLSTYGSMLVLQKIRDTMSETVVSDFVQQWILSFGVTAVWSEYTLYRIVLDHFKVRVLCTVVIFLFYVVLTRLCYVDNRYSTICTSEKTPVEKFFCVTLFGLHRICRGSLTRHIKMIDACFLLFSQPLVQMRVMYFRRCCKE
jgi:hypothetical protein